MSDIATVVAGVDHGVSQEESRIAPLSAQAIITRGAPSVL
jgi:hypothetical protein